MNQHGSVEVAALEHAGDVLQVLANLLSAGRVARVIGECFNASSILV